MRAYTHKGTEYQLSDAHPAADCLPWLTENEEFEQLVESMRTHGYDPERPIAVLKDGRIIGGRRRELAAKIAGVTPIYTEVEISEDKIVDWVVMEDLNRRNLTPSQRAMSMVELAKLNQNGTNRFSREKQGEVASLFKEATPETIDQLAEKAQVGKSTIEQASKVKKNAPELMGAVKEGDLSASTAAKVADLPKPARKRVAESANPKAQAKKELDKAKASPPDEAPEAEAEPVDPEKEAAEDCCREIGTLCKDIDAIVKSIKQTMQTHAKYAFICHWDSALQQLQSVRTTIHQGRPVNRCPYCESRGKTDTACRCCKGTGYCSGSSRKAGLDAVGGKK